MIKKAKEHLKDENKTYFQHFKVAFKVSRLMYIGSIQAFLHAVLPGIFKKSASNKIKQLHSLISNRNN
tara:strand:- start:2263 stop:2466 length:204 start_codon:yes stop_codon:yes gene_type:complete